MIYKSGVYIIKNVTNNKVYLGSSKNVYKRMICHKSLLNNNKHHNSHLQNAWNKYGKECFNWDVIKLCDPKVRHQLEQKLIDEYDSKLLYNINDKVNSVNQDNRKKSLLLLDLNGEIVKYFSSGLELAEYFNTRDVCWRQVNTCAIFRKKYRIVTIKFFNKNINLIRSWPEYRNKAKWNKYERSYVYICKAIEGNEIIEYPIFYKGITEVASTFNISTERVRQVLENKDMHVFEKQGFIISKKRIKNVFSYEDFIRLNDYN